MIRKSLPVARSVGELFGQVKDRRCYSGWQAYQGALRSSSMRFPLGGTFHPADFALLGAVIMASLGFAEGVRLAHNLGGWQVICRSLVLSVPFLCGPVGFAIWKHGLKAAPSSWTGFGYASIVSMFIAFFAWYRGLAAGGVARISQIQLLQPFLAL
jgi:drug/metabolite transporter (DMT)-like permease